MTVLNALPPTLTPTPPVSTPTPTATNTPASTFTPTATPTPVGTASGVTKYYYPSTTLRTCFGALRVAMNVGGTIYYLHADHLGSTSVVTNQSGAVVSAQTYFAFGALRTSTGTSPTDFGFTGQRFDASTTLMYYSARYYDAELGRFTQADTIVPSAGNPQAFNRHAYTLNNPVRYIDPSGHIPPQICPDGWCMTEEEGTNAIQATDRESRPTSPPRLPRTAGGGSLVTLARIMPRPPANDNSSVPFSPGNA